MPDASIDDTLADPPDCPKVPCSSSANDGLTAFSLACLSRNQQSSNVPSSHRGSHWHTRDLMTFPGPCKSKTGDPTSRALGRRASELAQLHTMQPAASSQWPTPSSEGASQGRGSERCHRMKERRRERCRRPVDASRCLINSRNKIAHRFAKDWLSCHLFAFFRSSIHSLRLLSFLPSQQARLYASSKTCLVEIVKLVMRVSPSILHGLWGPLRRMADASRSLPRSCFSLPSVTFPFCLCYRDLPSPLLLCSPSPGYPDKTAERL